MELSSYLAHPSDFRMVGKAANYFGDSHMELQLAWKLYYDHHYRTDTWATVGETLNRVPKQIPTLFPLLDELIHIRDNSIKKIVIRFTGGRWCYNSGKFFLIQDDGEKSRLKVLDLSSGTVTQKLLASPCKFTVSPLAETEEGLIVDTGIVSPKRYYLLTDDGKSREIPKPQLKKQNLWTCEKIEEGEKEDLCQVNHNGLPKFCVWIPRHASVWVDSNKLVIFKRDVNIYYHQHVAYNSTCTLDDLILLRTIEERWTVLGFQPHAKETNKHGRYTDEFFASRSCKTNVTLYVVVSNVPLESKKWDLTE